MASPVRTPLYPALLVATLAAGCGALAAACGSAGPEPEVAPQPTASAPPPAPPAPPTKAVSLKDAGVTAAYLDRSVDPCTDFYQLSCGTLIKTVEIPADRATWGPTQELQLHTEELLRSMLEGAAKNAGHDGGDDPIQKKLGAWYGACMDEPAIEKAGLKPIKPLLDVVAKVKDDKSLFAAIIALHKASISPAFGIGSQQDFKDATLVIAALDQDGLGLPDRDYYLEDDAKTKDIREFYRGHVERMLVLAGDKPAAAKKAVEDILRIESKLAHAAQDKVVRRDPYKVYNKIDRKGLADAAKGFPWDAYFDGLGFSGIKDVSVNSVPYFAQIDKLMVQEKAPAWRQYLRWVVLSHEASRLGKAFVDERFAFRQKLTGQKELEPRWKRCVQSADGALGELLAQAYVKLKFDAESKRSAEDLIKAVRGAMKVELGSLPWMDAGTRAAAEDKLAKMDNKIGYPVRWKAYDFDVSPSDYAKNAIASDVYELARTLKKVGKPLDRTEWQMTPPTVNAYYDPSMNEMVFPAGILQPPFFDKGFAAAVNFGATGATMGHELTHGFDDEGSQFDGAGNLRNWWSDATGNLFKEQTKCVADQYGTYEAVPGVKLNGELTLGENIADIGGVKIAYTAYRDARKDAPERISAEGYTEDQVFFLAYGQSWCEKERPEILELMAKTNPHSPPRFRVNGVLADVPAFAEAFACKEGTPMRPAKVCAVW
jgi:putative endopeptidase